ncbi:glycosyl transferase family 2 [Mumia flava]|uniref:Glycosyl transferase family 2 n=1 Tax=Mumia flava TaxID=1348852 RepID=A0A2M9BK43_9ACTN|nr:glycosyltransferase [Mumia flava]PJJ58323.1 glycosyl transferase family 2 [Mumia flava]
MTPASPSAPPVTVVICAYTERRLAALRRAVVAVRAQLGDDDRLVVVIDHNPGLLRACRASLDCEVVASQGRPGLSGARNTGAARSVGRGVVAFLDDDACPRAGWLAAMRDAFAEDDVVAVGGAVRARWVDDAPRWFPVELGWVVGCDYRGLPGDGAQVRNPIGASMAVRADALDRVGGFSEELGRVGALPVGCEETELAIRIAGAVPDGRIVRITGAVVDHDVPSERARLGYVLRRGWHEGRSKARLARMAGPGTALASERDYLRRVVPTGVVTHLVAPLRRGDVAGPSRAVVLAAAVLATAAGYLGSRALGLGTRSHATPALRARGGADPGAGADSRGFVPIACTDLELGADADQAPGDGAVNARGEAAVLVRDHGWPTAFVRLDRATPPRLREQVKDVVGDSPTTRPERWPWGMPPVDASITVVVCSLGQDPRLRATVDLVLAQDHPDLEVVVVDNDPARGTVRRLLAPVTDARVRIVDEPRRGLSEARNTGLAAARGAIVAYTDDDARPDADWVSALLRGFGPDLASGPACVTGLVVPAGFDTSAQLLFEETGGFGKGFAATYWSARTPAQRPLGGAARPGRRGVAFPYGAGEMGSGNNMAFRADVLRRVGGFDVALGAGTPTRGGEDLDILRTLYLEGETVLYLPAAVVRHHHRDSLDALRTQMFGYGSGMAASVTKLVVTRPATALRVLRVLPAAARLLLDPGSPKNESRTAAYPADVVRAEVRGYVAGPWLYVRSRAATRRQRPSASVGCEAGR